ncbi:MAG: helix-turn-helix domain-containing protein [Gammaproteobacteria bacterium]
MTIESTPQYPPKSTDSTFNQPGDADRVASLRIVVMRLLPSGYPKLERVARELNIARRTLQRRLAEAETSYTELVNEARMKLAEQMLKDRSRSIASIAVLTGFANHSGFSRAFHRWKGMTPRQFRAKARREVLPAESVDQIGNRVE